MCARVHFVASTLHKFAARIAHIQAIGVLRRATRGQGRSVVRENLLTSFQGRVWTRVVTVVVVCV